MILIKLECENLIDISEHVVFQLLRFGYIDDLKFGVD